VSLVSVSNVGFVPNPGGTILSVGPVPQAVAQQLPPVTAGRLNVPFFNAPPGFEGNHGLWREADRVQVDFRTSLGSVEAVWRSWLLPGSGLQMLLGPRYLDQQERLTIFTQDDLFTAGPRPDLEASYRVRTHNHILAAQLGGEWDYRLTPWLGLSAAARGAWGANFLDADVSLVRGDGLVGLAGHRSRTTFGHLYEAGLFADIYLWERFRLHAGYNLLWLPRLTRAMDQLDYNLAHPSGHADDGGSAFYHGPVMEVLLAF
jgi:hypothetical protein